MPTGIVAGNEHPKPNMNGSAANSFVLACNSLEEDSFVVLERSTASDLGLNLDAPSSLTAQPNCSFPVFNNLTSGINPNLTSQHGQEIPVDHLGLAFESTNISVSVEEIEKRLQEVLHENVNLKENLYQTNLAMKQQLSTVRLLQDRAHEVQKNHQAKFEETKALILKLTSEKNDFVEANNKLTEEINKIKEENKELRETNSALGAEAGKLLAEQVSLKKQLLATQETLQAVTESSRKTSLQPSSKEVELHQLVDQLTRKLEAVERARRQQEFDIDKLRAQLGRATQELTESERKLAHASNALAALEQKQQQAVQNQPTSENIPFYRETIAKYEGPLTKLKSCVHEEQTRFESLTSWFAMTEPGNTAQFEIAELRRLLAEEQVQSVARKENLCLAITTMHELLSDFQKLGEELERVKADFAEKRSHSLAYDEMQQKGFRERLDSLTAKLVQKEEALAISTRHLASLREAVRLQNDEGKVGSEDNEEEKILKDQVEALKKEVAAKDELLRASSLEVDALKKEVQGLRTANETITVLEAQAKIYKDDFEAERKSRESLVEEKERLLEDIRRLTRRNEELDQEIREGQMKQNQTPNTPTNTIPRPQEQSQSPPPAPRPEKYVCPNSNCNLPFSDYNALHQHVFQCLNLDD